MKKIYILKKNKNVVTTSDKIEDVKRLRELIGGEILIKTLIRKEP